MSQKLPVGCPHQEHGPKVGKPATASSKLRNHRRKMTWGRAISRVLAKARPRMYAATEAVHLRN